MEHPIKENAHKKIRVLIVDDSALIRKILTEIINSDPQLEVIGTAADPYIARDKIKALHPDVLTLDVEMPKMDGLTFLANLMRLHPLPVIMISSLTEKGADVTLQALELGAIDYISKPKLDLTVGLSEYRNEIITKIKIATAANLGARLKPITRIIDPKLDAEAVIAKAAARVLKTTDKIIAIGASTGGTEAIKDILEVLPPDMPGIVITQHIPEVFSRSFAERMNRISELTVCEAQNGMQIMAGHAYIAPGNFHLLVERTGAKYICRINDGPPVNRHRPSVDVLFRSVAQSVGFNAVGVILTGMGDDGAMGMEELHQVGCHTIAQDEKSSVVWGMPQEAIKRNCVDEILPLNKIAQTLTKIFANTK